MYYTTFLLKSYVVYKKRETYKSGYQRNVKKLFSSGKG